MTPTAPAGQEALYAGKQFERCSVAMDYISYVALLFKPGAIGAIDVDLTAAN